jgi:carboxyl-terminal processing protease
MTSFFDTAAAKQKITFFLAFFVLFSLPVAFASSSFAFSNEVSPAVQNLNQKGVFGDATANETFVSSDLTTRGEFLQWTLRNAGFAERNYKHQSEKVVFNDIPSGHKLFPFVSLGLSSGALESFRGKENFLPNRNISRLEAMKILFAIEGISTFDKHNISSDIRDLPRNAFDRAIMLKAMELQYLKTTAPQRISPRKKLTKEEVVSILLQVNTKKTQVSASQKDTPIEITQKILLQDSIARKDLSLEKLEEEALTGMMDSLDDKYSVYMPPKKSEAFTQFIEGNTSSENYVGIGVAIVQSEEGRLIITEVFDGGPADTNGLLVGDEIESVNNEDITALTTSEIIAKIKGEENTIVTIGFVRMGSNYTKKIMRKKVVIDNYSNVSSETKDNIVWIKVRGFKSDTAQDFEQILKTDVNESTSGVIVDLRYNPGGLMSAAQKMLGQLLPEKSLALRMVDEKGKDVVTEGEEVFAIGKGEHVDVPLVVFQNEHSASASEIFSGSIQDYGRGEIIGKKSFGKGVAQRLYNLSNGGSVKVTTNEFFTPHGNPVHHEGITPDVLTNKVDDNSLFQLAKRYLK